MNTCKLCLLERDLQESHYIPRFGYKAARASQLKNQNPVVLVPGGVRQSQQQMKDYVFCAECEQRFNEGGEKWVLARLPRDYHEPFVLQEALIPAKPLVISPGLDLYEGTKLAAFNMDKLVYFAASIFWRGAVHEWEIEGQRAPKLNLEDKEEPLRIFSSRRKPFPV